MQESIAFSIDHSGEVWGAHVRALCTASGQPGSQPGILARVLGSWPWRASCPWRLIIGSRFPADSLSRPADPPSLFFFCSSGSGLSLALPHLLHSSPGAGSLLPKPQLPTQLSRIRTSPSLLPSASPPHRTPVVGLRLALSHFPIDDSWIRRGEAPAARAGGEFVARAPPWPHSVLRSSGADFSFLRIFWYCEGLPLSPKGHFSYNSPASIPRVKAFALPWKFRAERAPLNSKGRATPSLPKGTKLLEKVTIL